VLDEGGTTVEGIEVTTDGMDDTTLELENTDGTTIQPSTSKIYPRKLSMRLPSWTKPHSIQTKILIISPSSVSQQYLLESRRSQSMMKEVQRQSMVEGMSTRKVILQRCSKDSR
jgi:hypothetical protein